MPAVRVVLSVAVSLDGRLDDASGRRLVLSSPADLDEVDELRAWSDAIVVGAGTVRADDPRLLVRSPQRRQQRAAEGRAPSPLRVVLTRSGDLPAGARLFHEGFEAAGAVLLLAPATATDAARERIGRIAQNRVADAAYCAGAGEAAGVVDELARRGARRILVEGGSRVVTDFLAADAVDELRLAVAPVVVGDPAAPGLLGPGGLAWRGPGRVGLLSAHTAGDTAVLRYDMRAGEHVGGAADGGAGG